jgi:hypothetical protein
MDVEEKVVKDIEALVQQENIAELVKDNVITFEHAGIKYRVTKPTFDQKLEANKRKAAEHIRMLKDSNYLLEKDWIELYKSRGIDVKELDRKFDVLAKKKTEYQLKLGEAIETKAPEEDCEVYRKEISAIISEQLDITGEKSKLLDSSIESQLNVFIYTYLAYLLIQTPVPDGSWVRAFKSYEDFLVQEETLVNTCIWYSSLLFRSDIIGS